MNTQEENVQLHCSTENCKGKEFKLENIKPDGFSVINENGDTVYGKSLYTYRCLTCQKVFSSTVAPKNKKFIHG